MPHFSSPANVSHHPASVLRPCVRWLSSNSSDGQVPPPPQPSDQASHQATENLTDEYLAEDEDLESKLEVMKHVLDEEADSQVRQKLTDAKLEFTFKAGDERL